MRYLQVLMMLMVVASVSSAMASGDAWRAEKDADGIRMYTRAVEGWDIREVRGVMQIKGTVSSLVAVIEDESVAPQLNEFVVKSSVVQRDSGTRYRLYTLTKMPWPLKDRDVLMQREISTDPASGVVTIVDDATRDLMPAKKGLVRIVKSRQQWTLTPAADGRVDVELRLLSDPAGPIPTSLINSLSVSTPFKTLVKLRELAQLATYANASTAPADIGENAGGS